MENELTLREQSVLELIVQGLTNKEIADELFISLGTTKSHIKEIFGKLNVVNKVQASMMAAHLGLVDVSEVVKSKYYKKKNK